MLTHPLIDISLETDFFADRTRHEASSKNIVYTGMIDQYFDYCYGELAYRSLHFETKVYDTDNYQGTAVMNFTDSQTPYTRIIEHKHFCPVVTKKQLSLKNTRKSGRKEIFLTSQSTIKAIMHCIASMRNWRNSKKMFIWWAPSQLSLL